jgi:cobalt-zinc-cadmium efflux system protein
MAHPHGAHRHPHEDTPHAHVLAHPHDAAAAGGRAAGDSPRAAHQGGSGFTAHEAHQAGRLTIVLAIIAVFFVLELGGAILAESVVLQADAVHLLTDVLALGVSLFAMRLAVRRPTPRFTYGLRRAEPVAAIFSALLVLATTAGIVVEGIRALHGQSSPKAGVMLVVAVMALFANGLSAWLVHDAIHPHGTSDGSSRQHGHALNLRGVSLHLIGDTLGAVAALCAALIIRFGGPAAADPIASFVVAAILLYGSLGLLRDATLVLLEAAPPHLPVGTIRQLVGGFPGVAGVHDLHVWALGAGHDAVTVHVRTDSRDPQLGKRLSDRIRAELGVEYVTVQVDLPERAEHAGHDERDDAL